MCRLCQLTACEQSQDTGTTQQVWLYELIGLLGPTY
jgi:hypothetical protein